MEVTWIEYRERGLYCVPGDFYLDPHAIVERAVISHAHADHYPRGLHEVHATPATLAIAAIRYAKQAGRAVHPHPYQTPFEVNGVTVEFFPAGHILGSAQILLRHAGQTVLYTGDLSLQPNPTCEPLVAPGVPIDLLICESTFAAKDQHSSPQDALRATARAAGSRHLLIGVYSVGKAQHVTRMLHETLPGMPVFVHYEIYRYNQLYEEHGIQLGPYQHYQRQTVKAQLLPHVHLVPPRILSSHAKDYRYHKVKASGWDAHQQHHYLDGNLDISDHVAAGDIQGYLQTLRPRQTWFWHGSPAPLLAWCQAQGIQAREVKRGQRVDNEEAAATPA